MIVPPPELIAAEETLIVSPVSMPDVFIPPEVDNLIREMVFTAIESFVPSLRLIRSLVWANDTTEEVKRNAISMRCFMIFSL